MNLTSVLLAPFALFLPTADVVPPPVGSEVAGSCTWQEAASDPADVPAQAAAEEMSSISLGSWPGAFVVHGFRPDSANQVRMEQSLRIRIAPRPSSQPPQIRPDMLVGVPQRAIGSSFVERRIGRCLPVSSIAGVQPNGGNDLLLFLRDRRIVRAQLERSCKARDFYSGFYLAGGDGRLCVERDMLQSRSGANCKLSEIRQLVETGD